MDKPVFMGNRSPARRSRNRTHFPARKLSTLCFIADECFGFHLIDFYILYAGGITLPHPRMNLTPRPPSRDDGAGCGP